MKIATVSAQVEYDVKEEAEGILQRLGIPASAAISALYRQIIYTGGLPFRLVLPKKLKSADVMTADEFEDMLTHSYEQSLSGQGRPFDELFDELEGEITQ